MKLLPLHALVLLSMFLHSGSCSDGDGRCVPLFVRVGGNATFKCSVTNPDQDGVYMYRQRDEKGRVETNEDFRDFSVSINNVSEHDGGVYWCRFNKRDLYTFSERTCLLVQSGTIQICTGEADCKPSIYLGVIGGLSFIILVLVVILVKLYCDHGNYTARDVNVLI